MASCLVSTFSIFFNSHSKAQREAHGHVRLPSSQLTDMPGLDPASASGSADMLTEPTPPGEPFQLSGARLY